ncbi:MAG: leucine-rich repeat domain-containing protein [Candidatus Thorarchaeota archaeon]|nr:leucine-rich repeat domain-containing protein [Candidatus Thorarchaeota archaeon]
MAFLTRRVSPSYPDIGLGPAVPFLLWSEGHCELVTQGSGVLKQGVSSGCEQLRTVQVMPEVKEFKGVALVREDHDQLLSIQREIQTWADVDDEFVAVRSPSGFYKNSMMFMVQDRRVVGLQMRGMGLERLPLSVFGLRRLETLLVDNNGLRELPREVAELPRLTRLDITINPLGAFPEVLRRIKTLRSLRAVELGLVALPEWIGNLAGLGVRP